MGVEAASLRIVTELSPPHQTVENGRVAGVSTQIVEATLQQAGLQSRIEVYPWARAFYIATSVPNVLIYNIARTAERENEFHWIGPVANYRLGLVRLAERTDLAPNHLQDLGSAVIAVQRDDFSYHWLKQQGMRVGKELQLSADILESWRLLLKGKVDYVIDDEAALRLMERQLVQPQGSTRFVLAIPQLEQKTYLAASKDTDPALVKKLQQAHLQVQTTALYQNVMAGRF
ncbi:amino acid ABC transporter substrate-binding protein [Rheinheimera mesophila]|uniref:Amino acid ABC transporter substrate-binding protein n=1 Tax=Rheinheimera mesophila TaxID=1547515 RepID=A0A3P3QSA8_9GAMM|nr:amino acid ABC transporter substrate-binding protein [Rheinheimera mesophila]